VIRSLRCVRRIRRSRSLASSASIEIGAVRQMSHRAAEISIASGSRDYVIAERNDCRVEAPLRVDIESRTTRARNETIVTSNTANWSRSLPSPPSWISLLEKSHFSPRAGVTSEKEQRPPWFWVISRAFSSGTSGRLIYSRREGEGAGAERTGCSIRRHVPRVFLTADLGCRIPARDV